jgi:hypothetical protein
VWLFGLTNSLIANRLRVFERGCILLQAAGGLGFHRTPLNRVGPGFWEARMVETQRWQAIPTQLERAEFEQFVLPRLSVGSRGPAPRLSLHKIFNYIMKILYLGCQR